MTRIDVCDLRAAAPSLHAGDEIALSGTVFTARDAAHKRFSASLAADMPLPIPIKDTVIYYAGPTPTPPGLPIGSAGPTTSSRMDGFAATLYDLGMLATIGKGQRSNAVTQALVRNGALYLCALGGAGALAARSVISCEVAAYPELGCESVKKLTLKGFVLFVAGDIYGESIYTPCSFK